MDYVVPRNVARGDRPASVIAPDAVMVAERGAHRLTTLGVFGDGRFRDLHYAELFLEMVFDVSSEGIVMIDLMPADDVPTMLLVDLLRQRGLSLLFWAE